MATTQVCSAEGCDEFALFCTPIKPGWCKTHLGDAYDQAGLQLLEPFTKPREYLFTRCTFCGFEGHYRFEYDLQTVGRYEKTCRACYWGDRVQYARLHKDAPLESVEQANATAENNLGPLTDPCSENGPHRVKCKRCEVITAK